MINYFQDNPMEALTRLIKAAQGDSHQSHHVRRFLLGLYNAEEWPFEMNRLRALDRQLQMACFRVLELDVVTCERDIHEYLENGGTIFQQFWQQESASSD
ncbi:DUF7673 family protein [Vreelandella aquamarina]|jgi:hypothetical protein|uniref:DUF7673 family protein n=1 Tax=Vreelandella aquamarina TaxID=77097 RepID=UPI000EC75DF8|nr:hypothetical protein [Halomonas meridiana]QDP46773.1 MAG: hypothetical protein Unbinned4contig1000_16 [Prokaryotic dsDNA virus sp.]HAO01692.1 hypothetical protein [Halomonas sp.]MCC4288539.1 hypothetical protein [Halomonas meridiana]QDP48136.1 MAG: hypothetical protein Tp170SUR00d2C46354221_43 [Prokaryotic dsDNA virus sp.]QDP53255.1 MAG: hypothetical protein Unbinned28contig1000_11 [Prokaryotic dsDNA virus sp.]|tara:strand:- start:286 stop:585 length:300 start_codon:yes stop_codon:yes gene_type:complete